MSASQARTGEPDRTGQIAEAERTRQAKLAETRRIQAATSTAASGQSSAPSGWQAIGEIARDLQDMWTERFTPLIARAKAEREERERAFLAAGGLCLRCFDEGPCLACERGLAVAETERARRVRNWVDLSGLPPRFRQHTFASFPGRSQLRDRMRDATQGGADAHNLVLMGAYGVGKTGLLAAAINDLAPRNEAQGKRVLFTSTPALFDRLRAGYEDGSFAETMHRCQSVALLILDDLGAEKPSEWVRERLYAIVNHRYERQLPIWASTNQTEEQLAAAIGERVWWRIREGARVIAAGGPNLRRPL